MTYWFLTSGNSQRDYSTFFEASTKCYPPWWNRLCAHFYSIAPVTFLSVPIQKAPSHVIIILAVGAMSRDMCSGPGRVGVFKYIPTAQSPFTLNVTSIIVTDSHNYSPHLWLMICISICICGRHWVGANYMSHIVLKVPN